MRWALGLGALAGVGGASLLAGGTGFGLLRWRRGAVGSEDALVVLAVSLCSCEEVVVLWTPLEDVGIPVSPFLCVKNQYTVKGDTVFYSFEQPMSSAALTLL